MQTAIVASHTALADAILEQMVYLPGGSFQQGSDWEEVQACVEEWSGRLVEQHFTKEMFTQWIFKEHPAFTAEVEPFFMSKYPVTNDQYAVYTAATGQRAPESLQLKKPGNHPVWGLTLEDIAGFIQWLNGLAGLTFRLPTETEWEYAARGPQHLTYPFGNEFDARCCNTKEAGIMDTTAVDAYELAASGFGICDMAGNVEEWTSDTYRPYPGGTMVEDDLFTTLGQRYPVIRGGSFNRGGDLARCARRHGPYPSGDYKYIGFRLATNTIYHHL